MRRVTDKDIPRLLPHVGSWVLIRKSTGDVIGEVQRSDKAMLKSFNADNIEIKPIDQHLGGK